MREYGLTDLLKAYSDKELLLDMEYHQAVDGSCLRPSYSWEVRPAHFARDLTQELYQKKDFESFFRIIDICDRDCTFQVEMNWEGSFLSSFFTNAWDNEMIQELIKHPAFVNIRSAVFVKNVDEAKVADHPFLSPVVLPEDPYFGSVMIQASPNISIKEMGAIINWLYGVWERDRDLKPQCWGEAFDLLKFSPALKGVNLDNTRISTESWSGLKEFFGSEIYDENGFSWDEKQVARFMPILESKMRENLLIGVRANKVKL